MATTQLIATKPRSSALERTHEALLNIQLARAQLSRFENLPEQAHRFLDQATCERARSRAAKALEIARQMFAEAIRDLVEDANGLQVVLTAKGPPKCADLEHQHGET